MKVDAAMRASVPLPRLPHEKAGPRQKCPLRWSGAMLMGKSSSPCAGPSAGKIYTTGNSPHSLAAIHGMERAEKRNGAVSLALSVSLIYIQKYQMVMK